MEIRRYVLLASGEIIDTTSTIFDYYENDDYELISKEHYEFEVYFTNLGRIMFSSDTLSEVQEYKMILEDRN